MQTLIEALQAALQLLLTLDARVLGTVALTLRITLTSLVLSTLLGLPVGAALGMAGRLRARGLLMTALYTVWAYRQWWLAYLCSCYFHVPDLWVD